ncbi:RmlC-like cupin [Pleurostoma richardsiae]|uniref:RmlC-like cupin n=1 Tax=Pleurostoma richardsiae TaxID=41990 RepID=A0AA38RMD5_9PEZI|nr:RmlC-like cupin [Pleurostoma richardsiae]
MAEIRPSFPASGPSASAPEPPAIQAIIDALSMQPHIEGGYFVETDRDPWLVPSPFPATASSNTQDLAGPQRPGFDPAVRNASTTIFYLITPSTPQGNFHRNRARTVHTLHHGRGRYVVIHADEGPSPRIETFVVGPDVAKGEKLQWIVEGGKYKASFLLPDDEGGKEESKGGLLISETVVPGFEFCDHDFLTRGGLLDLLGEEKAKGLEWLVRKD